MSSDFSSLRGQLLISMPSMQGDYFSHSVTLLIEHNRDGAFGLVISNPLEADLSSLLEHYDVEGVPDITVLESGPVEQNRLFFLHSNEEPIKGALDINDELALSTSLEVLDTFQKSGGPKQIVAGLGYAGWSGGQLESEIMADVWLVTPYNHDILFNIPFEKRPEAAARSIGVDLNLIATKPGHG